MNENIPSTWAVTGIGEIYDVIGGGTPSTKIKEYWNGNVPWITSADIHGVREISVSRFVSKKGIANSVTNQAPPKTLLVVTRVGLGKVAITEKDICFSQDLQGLVVSPELVWPAFALYFLSYELQKLKFEGRGTTISGLTKKQLKEVRFPLPSFTEQKRIVSKLEELLSELDKGIESFKTARKQLMVYRQAVLKHAFEGKLTEEWRKKHAGELESAETLLEKNKAEREQRYRQQLDDWKRAVKAWEAGGKESKKPTKPGKPKELPPLTEEKMAELSKLPENWIWEKLSWMTLGVEYGTSAKSQKVGKVPVLRMGNIQKSSFDWSDLVFSDDEDEIDKYRLKKGNVLFNRTNSPELVGKTAIYQGEQEAILQDI